MATPQFHPLRIRDVRPETADAVTVSFEVPPALREAFRFTQGQFVTLKTHIDGEETRRSYSICVGVTDYDRDGELRIGVLASQPGKEAGREHRVAHAVGGNEKNFHVQRHNAKPSAWLSTPK